MHKTDTTSESQNVLDELYRRMPLAKKFQLIFDAYNTGRCLSMAGLRLQYPDTDEKQIWHLWAKKHLGEELYNKVYNSKR